MQLRHQAPVTAVAFSPDGKKLASGTFAARVSLWDLATGKRLFRSDALQGAAHSVAFSPDGRALASWSYYNQVCVWESATGRRHPRLGELDASNGVSLAYSPDGRHLAVVGDDLLMCETDTGKQREVRRVQRGNCYATAFSPDGNLLAWAGGDKVIRVFDVARLEQRQRLPGHRGQVWALAFTADGKTLASAGVDGTLRLWERATRRERLRVRGLGIRADEDFADLCIVCPVAFSADARLLAWAAGGTIHLWEVASGKELLRFHGHTGKVCALAFSADGKRLASGGKDQQARVWDLAGRLPEPRRVVVPLGEKDLLRLWADLAGEDAGKAYQAIRALAAVPGQSMPFLGARLRPVAVKPGRIEGLLADLGSDRFVVREKAMEELKRLGDRAGPALRRVLAGRPSPEVRWRVRTLLARLASQPTLPFDLLRILRAVEVLEQVGTPEACAVLRRLAGGPPGDRGTGDARAALRRVARRKARP